MLDNFAVHTLILVGSFSSLIVAFEQCWDTKEIPLTICKRNERISFLRLHFGLYPAQNIECWFFPFLSSTLWSAWLLTTLTNFRKWQALRDRKDKLCDSIPCVCACVFCMCGAHFESSKWKLPLSDCDSIKRGKMRKIGYKNMKCYTKHLHIEWYMWNIKRYCFCDGNEGWFWRPKQNTWMFLKRTILFWWIKKN